MGRSPLGPACAAAAVLPRVARWAGLPVWPFWSNVSTWWEALELPISSIVHFNNLKRDLPTEVRRASRAFSKIEIPAKLWPHVLEHCTFEYMS